MNYLTDIDEYQAALAKVDFSKDLNATKTGGFLMESIELECYNKCQGILDCPEMGAAHGYCLDVNFDDLRQDIIDKVNKLYQLGTERGFLKPYDGEGDQEEFDDDGPSQGDTRDLGDGSEMYDMDQSVYESRFERYRDMCRGRGCDNSSMFDVEGDSNQLEEDDVVQPQDGGTGIEDQSVGQDQMNGDQTDDQVVPDTTQQADTTTDITATDGQEIQDMGDQTQDGVSDDGDSQEQDGTEGPDVEDGSEEDDEDNDSEDGYTDSTELDDETKETRRNEFTELFRTTLNQFFKDKESPSDEDDTEGSEDDEVNDPEEKNVKHMSPADRAKFWQKIADGWEGKEDLSLFFDDPAEELDSLEEEEPDGTEDSEDDEDDEEVEDGDDSDDGSDEEEGSDEEGEDSEDEGSEDEDDGSDEGSEDSEDDSNVDDESENEDDGSDDDGE